MFGLPQCLAIVAVAVWAVLPILIKLAAFESNISLFLVVRFTLSTNFIGISDGQDRTQTVGPTAD